MRSAPRSPNGTEPQFGLYLSHDPSASGILPRPSGRPSFRQLIHSEPHLGPSSFPLAPPNHGDCGARVRDSNFVHLHVHSDYPLLDGACRIDRLMDRAKELGMAALALTDHGNLFGAIDFHNAVCRHLCHRKSRVCRLSDCKPIFR
jgi:PHP domain